jgi:hypothetical protein
MDDNTAIDFGARIRMPGRRVRRPCSAIGRRYQGRARHKGGGRGAALYRVAGELPGGLREWVRILPPAPASLSERVT